MALPTPLTSAQVSGAADTSEINVKFMAGAYSGLRLLVAVDDPNIADSVADGSILVDDPGAYPVVVVQTTAPAAQTTVQGSGV
jgi:hypothetical protein